MYILKVVYSTKQNNIFSTVDILAFGEVPQIPNRQQSIFCLWLVRV